MSPLEAKTTTINFRVGADVPDMLRDLAEAAGVTMTDYVVSFIRASYEARFPDKAHGMVTPAQRLQRQIRQDRIRAELDQALVSEDAGPLHDAVARAARARPKFDAVMGADRTVAVDEEQKAAFAFRRFEHEPRNRNMQKEVVRTFESLEAFYEGQAAAKAMLKKGGK